MSASMPLPSYRKFLTDEFERRLAKNPQYSIRAFARDLAISKTHLTEILRGKNQLSADRAATFVEKLNLSRSDEDFFLDLVAVESSANEPAKLKAQRRLEARFWNPNVIMPEEFATISEWYFPPLLELLTLPLENYSSVYLGSAGFKRGHFCRFTGPRWATNTGLKRDILLSCRG